MKRILTLSALLAVLIIAGCGYNSSGDTATGKVTPPSGMTILPTTNIDTPVNGQQAKMTTAPIPAATSNITLNPEHGKPGHRCDLAVGAPLNSSPATTTAAVPTAAAQPVQSQPQQIIQPVNSAKTAAGLNPAHGQPGHRCDLAVGAPLNSKPAATTPAATSNPVAPMEVTPILPTAQTEPVKVAPGMNPSHGQPGHRCDIAVGAPLPVDSTKKQ